MTRDWKFRGSVDKMPETQDDNPTAVGLGLPNFFPDSPALFEILYTNYRGEKDWRCIQPVRVWFGATEWHSEPQWLLDAVDKARDVERSFAMKDIEVVRPA